MKRKTIWLVTAFALALTGCTEAGGTLMVDAVNEKEAKIVMENASEDIESTTGILTVGNGEKVVFESTMDNGEVEIELIGSSDSDEDPDTDKMDDANAELEVTVNRSGSEEYEVKPGDYMLNVEIRKNKTNGSITIRTVPAEDTES